MIIVLFVYYPVYVLYFSVYVLSCVFIVLCIYYPLYLLSSVFIVLCNQKNVLVRKRVSFQRLKPLRIHHGTV